MKELIPVVAGFLLTTVLGGLLGSFFQRRAWAHQHRVQTQDRERAVLVFEEVSRLLDKRLYRGGLRGTGRGRGGHVEAVQQRHRYGKPRADQRRAADRARRQIYAYNLDMIRAIQGGAVGWLVEENRRLPGRDSGNRSA
ncbi:hypothetical protein [Streptomyces hiroshimensis]|uniref:Uncharacterized protein n=1 Tax=Streptomyces hiroshimensis TaxID=66424 RepID=A0ABQ2Y9H9_9ACTN|nr:hypothetical protein [Streptomyces hiroshimensis]GGX75965.1 hypothetical protein GCM10010324_21880 [Streptomyces hiroshimensis]